MVPTVSESRNARVASSLNTNRIVFSIIRRLLDKKISLSIRELLAITRSDIQQQIIDLLLNQNNNTDSDSDSSNSG